MRSLARSFIHILNCIHFLYFLIYYFFKIFQLNECLSHYKLNFTWSSVNKLFTSQVIIDLIHRSSNQIIWFHSLFVSFVSKSSRVELSWVELRLRRGRDEIFIKQSSAVLYTVVCAMFYLQVLFSRELSLSLSFSYRW